MLKIDWPCAVGGALVGYIAKGKVEDTKAKFRKICTSAMDSVKDSFVEEPSQVGGKNGH